MPTERPIQPNDPEREPKASKTAKEDQLSPQEHPTSEPYGKADDDRASTGAPTRLTKKKD